MNRNIHTAMSMALLAMSVFASPASAADNRPYSPIELAQSGPGRGPQGGGRPPREAFEACKSKPKGSKCHVAMKDGSKLKGTCQQAPQGRDGAMLCVPAGGPPRG